MSRWHMGQVRGVMHRFALLPWLMKTGSLLRRAGAGRRGPGLCGGSVGGGIAEGAQWYWRAVCRHCPRLDRSRPCKRSGARAPWWVTTVAAACACVSVLYWPEPWQAARLSLSAGGLLPQEVAACESAA